MFWLVLCAAFLPLILALQHPLLHPASLSLLVSHPKIVAFATEQIPQNGDVKLIVTYRNVVNTNQPLIFANDEYASYLYTVEPHHDVQRVLQLANDPNVLIVEFDSIMRTQDTRRITTGSDTWYMGAMANENNFEWQRHVNLNYTGKNVDIHVIDTGCNIYHEEFAGVNVNTYYTTPMLENEVCDKTGKVELDCNGHGTHVSGSLVGRIRGMAPGAYLYVSRTMNQHGAGQASDIIAALNNVKNSSRPTIVSMSLGGPYSGSGDDDTMSAVIKSLTRSGIIVVVAAGNENKDACTQSPARVDAAITVGNHGKSGERYKSSNYGECVDIYAPGHEILSAYGVRNNHYARLTGTSMATPLVAGTIALMLERNTSLSPADVKQLLQRYAKTKDMIMAISTKVVDQV